MIECSGRSIRSKMSQDDFEILFRGLVISVVSISFVLGVMLTITGKVSPWTGRFYSLLDPSYAKNHIPIIASVSEHQPTSWSSFYFDLSDFSISISLGSILLFF